MMQEPIISKEEKEEIKKVKYYFENIFDAVEMVEIRYAYARFFTDITQLGNHLKQAREMFGLDETIEEYLHNTENCIRRLSNGLSKANLIQSKDVDDFSWMDELGHDEIRAGIEYMLKLRNLNCQDDIYMRLELIWKSMINNEMKWSCADLKPISSWEEYNKENENEELADYIYYCNKRNNEE